jgi:4-amino-4-deoxy-L-arabinose transferase-like glycosyltransferase
MNTRTLKWLVFLAALGYVPTLAFYYVGEEAIFPISSLEMWHQREWIQQLMFGSSLQHNPLFNWMIIPFATLTGWEYVLPVTRALTIAATLATSAVAGWLTWRLLRDEALAWFTALVYLTFADVMLYRGWLAYVDPLFGFFVFSAIAALWIACEERRPALIAVAVASLSCAFMSKALTAYAFYGGAVLVLMLAPHRRRVLLGLRSIVLHVAAVFAPLLWLHSLPANAGQGTRMFAEILLKLTPADGFEYVQKLILYPLETAVRLSPAIPLLLYFAWRKRTTIDPQTAPHLKTASLIALVNFLPYWLAPISAIRYLLPIFPLWAFVVAALLWRAGQPSLITTRQWLAGAIALKFAAVVFLFPYYQSHYRGENYALTARDIMERTAGYPLYTTDVSASGMSVAGYIDTGRLPAPPVRRPPAQWDSGFVIAYSADDALGKTAHRYQLAGNDLYLLCRGTACQVAK